MMSNSSNEAASSLEFFKVFLPDFASLHMSIPPAFMKHLNGTFPEKATIQDHTGKSWCITLEKLDDLLYFKNGWQTFVDYHSLKYGDFLVFQYDGHCTFDVKIFGKNGCKKAVAAKAASSVPILEAEIAEAGNSVSNLEAIVADAGNSVSNLEAIVADAGNSVSNLEAIVADAGNSVSNLEAIVADAGNSVSNLEAIVADAGNSVSNLEAIVADAGNSVSNLEAVAADADYSVSNLEAVAADAGNSVSNLEVVVADAGSSVPILKVKEEPVVEEEDVEPSISHKRKRLQVGSDTVRKSKSIVASNCGRAGNASNSVEQVSPRGLFFERTMKRWSRQTIYISGRVVRDENISLKPNIVLRDEEGTLWPATVSFTSQNRISVTAGWSKFYTGHKLRINDKCDFEFVLERGNVCQQLNVKITRRSLALR